MGIRAETSRMIQRLLAAFFAFFVCSAAIAGPCKPGSVFLRGDWGMARFSVELAVTPEERAQGLMHRDVLPRSAGMLFVYPEPQRVAFWMKNTLIPLDLLFIDPTGTVRHIHHRAIPGDLTPLEGGDGILAVLEINGGLAKGLGITPGTQLRHPIFDSRIALWPC